MVKLNIGCGTERYAGYINIDIQDDVHANVVADGLEYLCKQESDSVEEILAIQYIEHMKPGRAKDFIREARRVLIPGGKLVIECPDIAKSARAFANGSETFYRLRQACFGGEGGANTDWGHHWGYCMESMRDLLVRNRFQSITETPVQGNSSIQSRDFRLEATK